MFIPTLPLWSEPVAAPALLAFVSPTVISEYGVGVGAGSVVTGSVLCTATGGTPPYTYVWTFVSGDVEIQVTSVNSPSTTFKASTPPFIFAYLAEWRCVVTDAVAGTVNSNSVEVQIERN